MEPHNKGKGAALKWILDRVAHQGDECLTWPFSRIAKGYGHVSIDGRLHYAHRIMCELVKGPPPTPEHQASHSCGNGHNGCVNGEHLSWKTNSGNQLDRRAHGTLRKDGVRTKLTPAQIAEIRSLKGIETQASLALRFGVKPGCIEYWHRHDRPPMASAFT